MSYNETELLQARHRNSRWEDGCYPQRLRGGTGNLILETKTPRGLKIPAGEREAIIRMTEEASTFPPDEIWHSK